MLQLLALLMKSVIRPLSHSPIPGYANAVQLILVKTKPLGPIAMKPIVNANALPQFHPAPAQVIPVLLAFVNADLILPAQKQLVHVFPGNVNADLFLPAQD